MIAAIFQSLSLAKLKVVRPVLITKMFLVLSICFPILLVGKKTKKILELLTVYNRKKRDKGDGEGAM